MAGALFHQPLQDGNEHLLGQVVVGVGIAQRILVPAQLEPRDPVKEVGADHGVVELVHHVGLDDEVMGGRRVFVVGHRSRRRRGPGLAVAITVKARLPKGTNKEVLEPTVHSKVASGVPKEPVLEFHCCPLFCPCEPSAYARFLE